MVKVSKFRLKQLLASIWDWDTGKDIELILLFSTHIRNRGMAKVPKFRLTQRLAIIWDLGHW